MKKVFSVLLLLAVFLCSCGSSNNLYDISKKVFEAKGYNSIAEITISGNKEISKYKVKQYYLEPDKLRIETLEPDFLKGKVLVRNGQGWKIYHPLIKQTFEVSKLKDDDELIFMGIIQKSIFTGEDSKLSTLTENGKRYVTIKSTIPGGNKFRSTSILYIDEKRKIPVGMDILDETGNVRIKVKYMNFVYCGEFKDSLFSLN